MIHERLFFALGVLRPASLSGPPVGAQVTRPLRVPFYDLSGERMLRNR